MFIQVNVLDNCSLTLREVEVMQLLASGFDDKRIAQALSLSTKTVAAHCDRIYSKLQASREEGNARVIAVSRAVAREWIKISEVD